VAAVNCPACRADLRRLDAAGFDEKLVRALRHPEPATRLRAVDVLGQRRTRSAVPALVGRWREGADPYLAAEIVRALGRIGGREATTALREVATDPSVVVQAVAREVLGRDP